MSGLAVALLAVPAASGVLLVMPAEGREGKGGWVSEAVADLLPRDLDFLGVPAVDRHDRLRALAALSLPATPLTRATSIRVAEALGASRVVLASHEIEGSTVTLLLRLLDVEHGTLSAPLRSSGPLESLEERIESLAWDVALVGATRPSRTLEQLRARPPRASFPALRSYAEALAAAEGTTTRRQLERALAASPSFDEARLALGRLHLDTREWTAAGQVLSGIAPQSPLHRVARFLQGVALLERGRYREAAALYAALASESPSAAVLNNHALALLRLGSLDGIKASDVLRQAAGLGAEAEEVPFNLGWALLVEGNAEEAAFWLEGVVRRQPADVQARLLLTWALRAAGQAGRAEEEREGLALVAPSLAGLASLEPARRFERVVRSEGTLRLDDEGRSDAELAAVRVGRAGRLHEAGDLEGAVRELSQAAYLDPYSARVHLLLGRLLLSRGESDKAVRELRVSLWCRDDPAVRLELAQILARVGRAREARVEAERVLRSEPANAEARRLLGGP